MPAYINIDSQDPGSITPFWCQLLGVQVQSTWEDGNYAQLEPAKALGGLMLVFQRVPEPKVGKNRVHWDVHVQDLDSGTAQVQALGGRWTEPGRTRDADGFHWRIMADPEDNEFCICTYPSA